jgi:competence protein ComEC
VATFSVVRADAGSAPRLTWLGSGHALVARADERVVLIGGSKRPYELLERIAGALPYGRRTIDLVVVTDPRDTVALTEVLRHYRVLEVLDVGAEYPTRLYASWRAELRRRRIPVYALRAGASVELGSEQLTVLAPSELYPAVKDCAGILRLDTAHGRYLITGDVSLDEQEETVARGVDLRADTLIATGRDALDTRFMSRVRPRVAFASESRIVGASPLPLDDSRDIPAPR